MLATVLTQRFFILKDTQFRALFLRMLCNRLVDGMVYVVTAWMLLRMTGHASSVALQLTLTLLPSALLSPVIGTVTDRFSRRNLVVIADLFQGALIALTALMLALSVQTPIYLYAMTLAVGLSSLLHSVAARALLRELVSKEGLLSASSTISIANQTGGLFGPILGGLLAYQLGEVSVLAIAAGLAVVGGLNLLQIAARPPHGGPGPSGASMTAEYLAALRLLRDNERVRRLFVGCSLFYVSLPLLNFLLPLLTMKTFGLSVQTFGLIDAMFGIGGIAAGVFLHALEERFGHQPMIVGGVVIYGLVIALLPASAFQPWLIAMYLLIGFACHSGVGLMSELQREIPTAMQGRVLSMFSTCTALMAAVTVQLLGAVGGSTTVIVAYVVYGLMLVGFGLIFLRRWMRAPA
ncbi:MFS transporter [Roseateles amylovorans]|jgi:MFS transporter, DHA3 family, macrolide efflux protein|uniref:MFS transporter n=1 Tax=Roseateles amylovorans TaxID=2978473 RepID=A0ABY6AYW2_9BURK|nr:MFS transporter [Roseateles amylovorans]UXH77473.1 MFS transporter [Roseateles amylovorans]